MNDCMGSKFEVGDRVIVVAAEKPVVRFGRFVAKIVGERGVRVKRIGIQIESDYARGVKYVLPDCILRYDNWAKYRSDVLKEE